MALNEIFSVALLVFGFGFVIFFHELGHFLAAKYVGIKVEQFAVGFGQALFSYRKGMGITWGSSNKKYDELVAKSRESGTDVSLIGETEYRLNWIPLGGYVKMLGQDDMKPNAAADDPRAYNRKSIGARMLVVSAGVIMNIILAAIGFMVVFMIGFDAPPAVVGGVMPGSPAQQAGLVPGEKILTFDGKTQHDFTKITLYPALVEEGAKVPIEIEGVDGARRTTTITPRRLDGDAKGFFLIGIESPKVLSGVAPTEFPDEDKPEELYSHDTLAIRSGDAIVKINGEDVGVKDYYKLDRALQASGGKPITLTVRNEAGQEREESIQPRFAPPFSTSALNFAGLLPRATIQELLPDSPAKGKLRPGDIVLAVVYENGEKVSDLGSEQVREKFAEMGQSEQPFSISVLRNGQTVLVEGLRATKKVERGRYGLGVTLDMDTQNPVVASVVEGSPAAKAGIAGGAAIVSINGQPVQNWFDIQRVLASSPANKEITVIARVGDAEDRSYTLVLGDEQIKQLASNRYKHGLLLKERIEPRKAPNPLVAASWGVVETRDFILQFYLTLQRMVQGSVSYTNMMGPVGIFHAGTKFAFKGTDWLIWFLAMISANLAVVNFLPIPIVDGGLFTFLIIEKIQGKPLSARTQTIAQVVGLAMILGVFLLVTYQDIVRFL